MIKNAKALAPILLVIVALAGVVPVFAASEIIFYGYAVYTPAPDQVGATIDVFGIASSTSIGPPIALDFDNSEFTVRITGMTTTFFVAEAIPIGMYTLDRETTVFGPGALTVYEDAKVGGTAADYGNPATFSDGAAILSGVVDPGFTTVLTDGPSVHDGIFVGSGSGTCDFTGGSRLAELVAAEYYLNDWFLAATPVSDPNPTVPAGYHRLFNVKLVSPNDPTATVEDSWGGVKTLYR